MKLLVTGGAGFIGSAFVRLVMATRRDISLVNLDKLTYAGNLDNLASVAANPRYRFVQGDIADAQAVNELFASENPDAVVHFAAESHVDRSILSPEPVIRTNLLGTFTLLEAARSRKTARFVHVSTDEVYGSIDPPHEADESYPLRASSPYSASKAGSDLLALSYHHTYKMNVSVTRASNNYGPYQFPEKLIPLMISNALEDKALPVYGDGQQVRDWLFVDDHCRAILAVLEKGRAGEIYNIGGNCSLPNIEVIHKVLRVTGKPRSLITTVADRPGHDRRYALTNAKLTSETGWSPSVEFENGLRETVAWYRSNPGWVARVKSGAYREFYAQNYGQRENVGQPG
jgi:dTDP-glucose 4,6-dehydratase